MDSFFVRAIAMLAAIAIDQTYGYRSLAPMDENRTKEQLYSCLDKILCNYSGAGLTTDQEFCTLLEEDVKNEMNITLNPCSAVEHKPVAEHNNRVIW